MNVAMWANSPSPHQSEFYAALRDAGVNLRVIYFGSLRSSRRDLGWAEPGQLPAGENLLPAGMRPLDYVTDWQRRIHVIPGYSRRVNLQLAAACSRAGVPWVHWSESSQPSWRSLLTWPLKKLWARQINRHALGAFAQGEMARRDFVRWGVRREKISHLYYAVSAKPSEQCDAVTAEYLAGAPAFLHVGALCRRKAPHVLIEAFARASREMTGWRLVLVGDGPERQSCEQHAARLGIANRVLFRGVVPMPHVPHVLACGRVFVLPSRFDGWGVVLNEAAGAGLALIASDRVGAAYHLIDPESNGFRVRAGSVESLAAAMRAYIDNPQLAALHGQRSRQRFNDFTPAASAARFVTAIHGWFDASPERSVQRDQYMQSSLAEAA